MKRIVLIVIGISIFITAFFLLISTTASNSYKLTQNSGSTSTVTKYPVSQFTMYTNKKYQYGILYPSDWTYREFSDGDGVGFRPQSMKNDPANEFITVQVFSKPANLAKLDFEKYVKVAAVNEIQNYQSLASLDPIDADGIIGYETTWNVQPLTGGKTVVSLPITYFPIKNSNKVLQVFLNNKTYLSTYRVMTNGYSFQSI